MHHGIGEDCKWENPEKSKQSADIVVLDVVLVLEVQDNKIMKIRGDKEAPVNKGQTCVKGSFAYEYVHAKNRLTAPLIRKAGKLVETTWEEAYNFIAENYHIKTTFGPEQSHFCTCTSTNEVNYVTQKFMRAH